MRHRLGALILSWYRYLAQAKCIHCRMDTRLCGYPVVYDPSGQVVAVVAHTNSSLEYHFAASTQGLCRRLGQAHLGRDLSDELAQAA